MTPVEAALAALARQRRTSAELLALLQRKGYSRESASGAVARLTDLGYVDDLAYAAAFAGTVARSRAWGPRRVRQELARRGVPAETIEAGLARAAQDGADPSRNIQIALERLTRRGEPRSPRERNRVRAALARRGFEPPEITRAMGSMDAGELDDDPGEHC